MLEHLNQWDSLIWILSEELVDKIFVFLRNLALERYLLFRLVSGNGLLVATEGSVPVDELVEKNAECPHVKLVIMLPVINHFWRHVLQSTAKSVPLSLIKVSIGILRNLAFASPTEVANFKHVVFVHQKVLRLEVPMDETVFVEEVDAGDRLDEEVKGSFFVETALFFDEDEQVALRDILHDQVNILVVLQISIHPHDVHVLQLLVDLNLAT